MRRKYEYEFLFQRCLMSFFSQRTLNDEGEQRSSETHSKQTHFAVYQIFSAHAPNSHNPA